MAKGEALRDLDVRAGGYPDPRRAADLPDFISLLEQLRISCGTPSYRTLAKKVGARLTPARPLSHVTLSEMFDPKRRRLDLDLVVAVVAALGMSESTVAQWRQACVRVHADAKTGGASGVLRQLPADLPTFTGRVRDLHELTTAIEAAPEHGGTVVVSVIEGMGGIGKTQLALRLAHTLVRAGRYLDAQLYVNLHGFDPEYPPVDPCTVLGAFLRQLGVAPQNIPDALDERAAMFRDRLHGRRALVVLDNAGSEEQVRSLIPADPGCLVLVTSRRSLAGLDNAISHRLDVFSSQEATTLLARIAGADRVAAEQQAAGGIVALCGGLPLAVALAGARLRSRPAWTLGDLLGRLRADRIDGFGPASNTPRPVFELSYTTLEPGARRMFRLLAAHPGRDATAESAAALLGTTAGDALDLLEGLTDEYLLEQRREGRYEFHDLLRTYAMEKLASEESSELRDEALGRVLSWYAVSAINADSAIGSDGYRPGVPDGIACARPATFSDAAAATAWFDQELPNLTASVEVASGQGYGLLCSRISAAMKRHLYFTGRLKEIIELRLLGLDGARASGDAYGEALALAHLVTMAELGRVEEAEAYFAAALAKYREVGDEAGQVFLMSYMVFCMTTAGRTQEALAVAAETLPIARRVAEPVLLASALSNYATCLHDLRRPEEALEYVLEAVAAMRSTTNGLPHAMAVRNLGFTYLVLQRHQDAHASFTEATTRFHDAGDLYHELECVHGQARALHARGSTPAARDHVAGTIAILDKLDEPTADRLRRRLERSPIRYDERIDVDPTARA
jgi:tetratricopeptide (TPR) repeat protein